jgi:VanZ family protein
VNPTEIGRRHILWSWGPVALYMALVFAVSSISSLPSLPGNPSDKLEHLVEYGILGALLVRALGGPRWRSPAARAVIIAIAIAAVYGLTDEGHQYFVPGRDSDWHDALADAAGGVVGAGAVYAWGIIARFFKSSRSDRDAV